MAARQLHEFRTEHDVTTNSVCQIDRSNNTIFVVLGEVDSRTSGEIICVTSCDTVAWCCSTVDRSTENDLSTLNYVCDYLKPLNSLT